MELQVLLVLTTVLCSTDVLSYPRLVYRISDWDSDLDLASYRVRRETAADVSGDPSPTDPLDPGLTEEGSNTDSGYQDPMPTDAGIDNHQEVPVDMPQDPQQETVMIIAADPPPDSPAGTLTDQPPDTPTETGQALQENPSHNPLVMSRPGELPPLALPLVGDTRTQPEQSATEGSHQSVHTEHAPVDTKIPTDAPRRTPVPTYNPNARRYPAYVPYRNMQAPVALPQTGEAPRETRAVTGEGPPITGTRQPDASRREQWSRQFGPVALPQKQAPPKNARRPPARKGNQAGNKRPPPNWQGGGNAGAGKGPSTAAPSPAGQGQGQHPAWPPYPYYDPYYSSMYGVPPPPGSPAGGSGPPPSPFPPYPPYPPYRMGGDMPDMENMMRPPGFGQGFDLDFRALPGGFPGGFPTPCTNMSDPMCMQQRMMMMDIEGPYGEMDIEPYELDIEGPMAMHMLQKMGFYNFTNTNTHAPEITLNQDVLDAMQKRFGVNTTAGIQRMSANPEFQAFMYQVLKHSTPLSLAEFNANLSKTAVNRIIANLDSSPPNHRMAAGKLDQALLNTGGPAKDGGSLTLDTNHGPPNPWANMPNPFAANPFAANPFAANPFAANPFAPMPGQTVDNPSGNTAGNNAGNVAGNTAPLVQNPVRTEAARPGSFQALVQGPRGEGGERGEAAKAGNKTANTADKAGTQTAEPGKTQTAAVSQTAQQTGAGAASNTSSVMATAQPKPTTVNTANVYIPAQAGNQARTQTQLQPKPTATLSEAKTTGTQSGAIPTGTQTATKEQGIIGKESKKGMSKDQRTQLDNIPNRNTPAPIPAGTAVHSHTNGQANTAGTNSQGTAAGVKDSPGKPAPAHTGQSVKTDQIQPGQGQFQPGQGQFNPGQGQFQPGQGQFQPGQGQFQPEQGQFHPGHGQFPSGQGQFHPDHGQLPPGQGQLPPGQGQFQAGQGRTASSIPTGIREAGLIPGVTNNTIPVKADSSYSSTGFAIAAGTIIALIVILGPIACMLWKMREKHQERKRKQIAHRNRDQSENSIMESMVLHDFGKGNSVANEAAEKGDYYTYGRGRYTTINADLGEVDELGANPHSARGRLP